MLKIKQCFGFGCFSPEGLYFSSQMKDAGTYETGLSPCMCALPRRTKWGHTSILGLRCSGQGSPPVSRAVCLVGPLQRLLGAWAAVGAGGSSEPQRSRQRTWVQAPAPLPPQPHGPLSRGDLFPL